MLGYLDKKYFQQQVFTAAPFERQSRTAADREERRGEERREVKEWQREMQQLRACFMTQVTDVMC